MILHLPTGISPRAATGQSDYRKHPVTFRILMACLRAFGWRLTSLESALSAHSGKLVCLVVQTSSRNLIKGSDRWITRLPWPTTLFIDSHDVLRRPNPHGSQLTQRLTWRDLRALAQQGWSIGTVGHNTKTFSVSNEADQKRMIADSISIMTARLGERPRLFSYPEGAVDMTALRLVRQAEFSAALTNQSQVNDLRTMRWRLGRLYLTGRWTADMLMLLKLGLWRRGGLKRSQIHTGQTANSKPAA